MVTLRAGGRAPVALVDDRTISLDARQLAVARRVHAGTALLTGAPGTGKTAVALRRLAARPPGRLLYLAPHPELARAQAAAYRTLRGAPHARFAAVPEWTDDLALRGGGGPYDAVVVDEAQQLTVGELRRVHALAADLLLVSAAAPGRWLTASGLPVCCTDALVRNYRSAAAVLEVARGFDPAGPSPGDRRAGTALRYLAACRDDHDAELVAAVRSCPVPDRAVLTGGAAAAAYYRRVLHSAQISAVGLGEHPGLRVEAVQVGPAERARGLEFGAVFLPDLRARPARDAYAAVTRAREYVWTGNILDAGRHR